MELKDSIRYRKCTISQKWITRNGKPPSDSFEWMHPEYDGTNGLCGQAPTIEECIYQINDAADKYFSQLTQLESILERGVWKT